MFFDTSVNVEPSNFADASSVNSVVNKLVTAFLETFEFEAEQTIYKLELNKAYIINDKMTRRKEKLNSLRKIFHFYYIMRRHHDCWYENEDNEYIFFNKRMGKLFTIHIG
jgi:hypothetical protein